MPFYNKLFEFDRSNNKEMINDICVAMYSKQISVDDAMMITREMLNHMTQREIERYINELPKLFRNVIENDTYYVWKYDFQNNEYKRMQKYMEAEKMREFISRRCRINPVKKDFLSKKDMEL